jgi:hypothetical protein
LTSFLQPKDVILKAMNIACANNKRRLSYVVGILKNWGNESLGRISGRRSDDSLEMPEKLIIFRLMASTGALTVQKCGIRKEC